MRRKLAIIALVVVIAGCAHTSATVQWKRATTAYNSALAAFTEARRLGVIDDERYALVEAWRQVAAQSLDLMEVYAFELAPGEAPDEQFQDVQAQFYTALDAIKKQSKPGGI